MMMAMIMIVLVHISSYIYIHNHSHNLHYKPTRNANAASFSLHSHPPSAPQRACSWSRSSHVSQCIPCEGPPVKVAMAYTFGVPKSSNLPTYNILQHGWKSVMSCQVWNLSTLGRVNDFECSWRCLNPRFLSHKAPLWQADSGTSFQRHHLRSFSSAPAKPLLDSTNFAAACGMQIWSDLQRPVRSCGTWHSRECAGSCAQNASQQ